MVKSSKNKVRKYRVFLKRYGFFTLIGALTVSAMLSLGVPVVQAQDCDCQDGWLLSEVNGHCYT